MGMDTYRPSQSYGQHPVIWSLFILFYFIYYENQSYQSVNLEIWSMVVLCSMPFK